MNNLLKILSFRVQIQLYQMEKIVKKAAVSIAEAVGPKFIKFFRFVECFLEVLRGSSTSN